MKTISLSLVVAFTNSLFAKSINYIYNQGRVVYQIQFKNKLSASVPSVVQSYFSGQDWKYTVFFDSTASIETSPSSTEEKLSSPFKWDDQCTVRQTNIDNYEVWKELNNRRYRYSGQIENTFQSLTGNKKMIAGLTALECIIKWKDGTKYTGWVTNALPNTAGLQMVKGCQMALIVVEQPNAIISIAKAEKQIVSWKNIWSTRPKIFLQNDNKKEVQQVQRGNTSVNATFPVFNIITSTGKRVNSNSLAGRTTVFFFCDPILATTQSTGIDLKISNQKAISADEKYLNMMEKTFRGKDVQVLAPIPYRLSEILYAVPSLQHLKLVSIVADPSRTLFDTLKITNYPFVIVTNGNGVVKLATTCYSEEDTQTFITETLQVATQSATNK